MTQCPRCHHQIEPVAVAGHTQCPYCHSVIDECCTGDSVHRASEELGVDPLGKLPDWPRG